MGILTETKTICEAAELACYEATFVLPPAFACGRYVRRGKADAGLVLDAAATWRDTHDTLVDAVAELRRLVAAVPDEVWSGKDRAAYEDRVAEFDRQCHDLASYAEAGEITLEALGYALAGFAVLSGTVAAVLTGTAIWVAAAEATIVGAPGAAVQGEAIASYCRSTMEMATRALEVVMKVGAGVFAAGELLDVGGELVHGSGTVLPDLVQAQVAIGMENATPDLGKLAKDKLNEKLDELAGLDDDGHGDRHGDGHGDGHHARHRR